MSKIIGITVGTPLSPRSIKDKLHPVTSVNGVSADEHGNVEVDIPTLPSTEEIVAEVLEQLPEQPGGTASAIPDDEMLDFLMEMDIVQPLVGENNSVFTDTNNKLYVL